MSMRLARALFAPLGHVCCECCDGFCLAMETAGDDWPVLLRLTVEGRDYISTPYVAVRADLVPLPEMGVLEVSDVHPPAKLMANYVTPAARPPLCDAPQNVEMADRFDRAGIELRADDSDPAAPPFKALERNVADAKTIVHLYLRGEHIGWTARARTGVRPSELERVRRVAEAACCDLTVAAEAYRATLEQIGARP